MSLKKKVGKVVRLATFFRSLRNSIEHKEEKDSTEDIYDFDNSDNRLRDSNTEALDFNTSSPSTFPTTVQTHRISTTPLNLEDFEKQNNFEESLKKRVSLTQNFNLLEQQQDSENDSDISADQNKLFDIQEAEEKSDDEEAASVNSNEHENDNNEKKEMMKMNTIKNVPQGNLEEENNNSNDSKNSDKSNSNDSQSDNESNNSFPSNDSFNEDDDDDNKYKLLSKSTLAVAQKKKCLIMPFALPKRMWDNLMACLIVYSIIVLPYRISFIEEDTLGWVIADYIVDGFFFIDVILTFMTAYFDESENLITDRKKIIIKYLTSWFVIDVLSIFPFEVALDIDTNYASLLRISRLPKLYKVIRLAKVFRTIRVMSNSNNIWSQIYNLLRVAPGIDRLALYLLVIFIFCHLSACLWYSVAEFNGTPDAWIYRLGIVDQSSIQKYVTSLYWITQTVITVGYGDIGAVTMSEKIIACIAMFAGVIFFSLTIGSLTSLLSEMDSKNILYEQKLNTLIQIQSTYHLPEYLFQRVQKALRFGLNRNNDDLTKFLNDLPVGVRVDLSMEMHKELIEGIEFFRGKQKRFIAYIGPLLKNVKIGRDEYVFTESEYANEMYFIKEGSVSMVIKDYNNFPFITIAQGYYFGEVDLLFGETRKFSYMAETDCTLLSISKKNYIKVFQEEFPDVGMEIQNNAIKRRIRAQKYYKEALKYCQEQVEIEKKKAENKEAQRIQNEYQNPKTFMQKISISADTKRSEVTDSFIKTNYKYIQDVADESKDKKRSSILKSKNDLIDNDELLKLDGGANTKAESLIIGGEEQPKNESLIKKMFGAKQNDHMNEAFWSNEIKEKLSLTENKLKNLEDNIDVLKGIFNKMGIEVSETKKQSPSFFQVIGDNIKNSNDSQHHESTKITNDKTSENKSSLLFNKNNFLKESSKSGDGF